MDVTEYVEPQLQAVDARSQLVAPDTPSVWAAVEESSRWAMSDEDVGNVGDECPLLAQRLAAFEVEGPIVEPRLPG